MTVTVRKPFKIRGTLYDRNQQVDLETWPVIQQIGSVAAARLARRFSEQNYFMPSIGATLATRPRATSVAPGIEEDRKDYVASLETELAATLDALARKDVALREQIADSHKGHRESFEKCASSRCAGLREVLAISATEPFVAKQVA